MSQDKEASQNKEPTIILLGDSILNNDPYVKKDKSVSAILKKSYANTRLLAKDGSTIADVYSQIKDINRSKNTFLFLSAGGNDILSLIDAIGVPAINENTPDDLYEGVDEIFDNYINLVEDIKKQLPNTNIALFNLYYPVDYSFSFSTDPDTIKRLITRWNKRLTDKYKQKQTSTPSIIKLNNLLSKKEDFTNSIEPSEKGGKKIAKLIEEYVNKHSE